MAIGLSNLQPVLSILQIKKSLNHLIDRKRFCKYSQTREKCLRPITSLRGLQGQKLFADAIIKILIPHIKKEQKKNKKNPKKSDTLQSLWQ